MWGSGSHDPGSNPGGPTSATEYKHRLVGHFDDALAELKAGSSIRAEAILEIMKEDLRYAIL
jgi:hypothetical protein